MNERSEHLTRLLQGMPLRERAEKLASAWRHAADALDAVARSMDEDGARTAYGMTNQMRRCADQLDQAVGLGE